LRAATSLARAAEPGLRETDPDRPESSRERHTTRARAKLIAHGRAPSSTSGSPEGDALVAVDVRHVHAHAPRLVDLDAREASRELLQRDAALEASERRAQAEVDAVPEREMRLGAAQHVEPLRVRELALVTVGGAGEEQDARALRHRAAIPRHVAGADASLVLRRRRVPQRFLDGVGDERRVLPDLVILPGMAREEHTRVREQLRDRLV